MKASKGCVNRECKSFKKKTKYKESFEFCPICGEKLEYVCADCWKVLEHSDKHLCEACKVKREQAQEKRIDQAKKVVAPVAVVVGTVWKNKEKIMNVGKKAIKVVKK